MAAASLEPAPRVVDDDVVVPAVEIADDDTTIDALVRRLAISAAARTAAVASVDVGACVYCCCRFCGVTAEHIYMSVNARASRSTRSPFSSFPLLCHRPRHPVSSLTFA